MTLVGGKLVMVGGTWYDNELGNTKVWRREGYMHEFQLAPNSDGIQIVKCKNCNESRMWIGVIENKRCP